MIVHAEEKEEEHVITSEPAAGKGNLEAGARGRTEHVHKVRRGEQEGGGVHAPVGDRDVGERLRRSRWQPGR